MGNTGTKDPHVHYQLKDAAGNVMDPTAYWDQQGPTYPDPSPPAYLPEYQQYLHDSSTNSDLMRNHAADDNNYRYLSRRIVGQSQAPDDGPISPGRSALFDERFGNWISSSGNAGPRNPDISRPSQTSMPSSAAQATPLAPATDSGLPIGGLLARLMAAAGIDPNDPRNLSPSLPSDQLKAFQRDDPTLPWIKRVR